MPQPCQTLSFASSHIRMLLTPAFVGLMLAVRTTFAPLMFTATFCLLPGRMSRTVNLHATNDKQTLKPSLHHTTMNHLFLCQAAATELIRLGVLSLFGLMHLQQLQSFNSPGFKFATYGLPTEKTKVDLKYWPRNPGLFRSLSCRAPPLAMKHHKQPRSNPKTSLFLPSSRTACNPCMQ